MRFTRHAVILAVSSVSAVTLAVSAVPAARASTSGQPTSDGANAPADVSSSRVVSLITGDQVQLSAAGGRVVATIDPGPPGTPVTRARMTTIGDRAYVVPDLALPYLGRQLDLSLFEITHPVTTVEIQSVGPRVAVVPGLTRLAAVGGTVTARVDSRRAFAAALRSGKPLPGVAMIRAARSLAPVGAPVGAPTGGGRPGADPHYPMSTLTIKGLDRNGARAISGSVVVDNVDDLGRYANMASFSVTGEIAFSVPVGTYSIAAEIATVAADGNITGDSFVFFPEITITAPATTVQADARTATTRIPVPVTPKAATVEQTTATFGRTSANGLQTSVSFMVSGRQPDMYATPTEPVTLGTVHWYTYFRLDGSASDPPYLYDLQFPAEGRVPATFDHTITDAELATVDARYHSDVPDLSIGTYRASLEPWELIPMRFASEAVAPLRRTEYVSTRADLPWASGVVWNPAENNGVDFGPWSRLTAGEQRIESHLAAPLVPGIDATATGSAPCPACRKGDTLFMNLAPWTGRGGRVVSALSASDTLTVASPARLYADDGLLLEMAVPAGRAVIPAETANLRLELETTKSARWTTTATKVRTVWRWRSAPGPGTITPQWTCPDGPSGCQLEPLLFLNYEAGVNQSNAIPAGTATEISIVARRQAPDSAPAADTLTIDVSTDDGETWTPAQVRADGDGRFTTTVTPASGTRFLSLRAHASDPAGSVVDQVITKAVQVTG